MAFLRPPHILIERKLTCCRDILTLMPLLLRENWTLVWQLPRNFTRIQGVELGHETLVASFVESKPCTLEYRKTACAHNDVAQDNNNHAAVVGILTEQLCHEITSEHGRLGAR